MPYLSIRGRRADGSLMTYEETDEATEAGHRIGVFRQCSIGWHEECSNPTGDRCPCDCHRDARRSE